MYDQGARAQISALTSIIDAPKALDLWERACATSQNAHPVWVHGDVAVGNLLVGTRGCDKLTSAAGQFMGHPSAQGSFAQDLITPVPPLGHVSTPDPWIIPAALPYTEQLDACPHKKDRASAHNLHPTVNTPSSALRRLCAVIDFGGMAVGDPACDGVMAWTYFTANARKIFMDALHWDEETWLRARAWALWKATFTLCHMADPESPEGQEQQRIITDVLA